MQVVEERTVGDGCIRARLDVRNRAVEPLVCGSVRKLVDPGGLEGQWGVLGIPEAPEEVQDGEEPADMVWVPVRDDDVGDVLFRSWVCAVLEGGFEEGDVTWSAFAGVDEGVGRRLADEISIGTCGIIFSQSRNIGECVVYPVARTFPGSVD